jgi:proline iminopeptidase
VATLYPNIEPYDQGMLDVGDDNHIYWETCGSPDGKAALVLHGGPGSGCGPGWRRFFDPSVRNPRDPERRFQTIVSTQSTRS